MSSRESRDWSEALDAFWALGMAELIYGKFD